MSRGQKPRTPEHFPRMRVRGRAHRRRIHRAWLRQQPLTLADIFRGVAEAARATTAPFRALAASIEAANRTVGRGPDTVSLDHVVGRITITDTTKEPRT